MLLDTEGHIGNISSEEIIRLENQITFQNAQIILNKFDFDKYVTKFDMFLESV